MLDPFPIPAPAALTTTVGLIADKLSLPTLPLHSHEVAFALTLYSCTFKFFAPWISRKLVPKQYAALTPRTKINWDVHVVSFVQSVLINSMSLYVIFCDEERKAWRGWENWEKRVWGYTGMTGLLQSQALGYFLWDLYMCSRYVHIFGWGMLAHAVSAVTVFSFGFRPFLYFYAPVFLLYELSSPFLNIHWFCDKLNLTGSVYQAVNGAFLTATFFSCRLVWGTYSSVLVFIDVYRAISSGYSTPQHVKDVLLEGTKHGDINDVHGQTTKFMDVRYLPLWLGASYLLSNVTLNLLNFWWFNKMVQTIRKRFDPPWGTKGVGPDVVHYQPQEKVEDGIKAARERAEQIMSGTTTGAAAADGEPLIQRGIYEDGHKSVEVSGTTATPARSTRSRRKG